uniref:POM121-like protein 12 n=1 Tax=Castor canadensis TaxID=51338 RepID=A0A8B7WJM7_CASCN|nr:POM121-like protein 12 [Castor canadensis]
MGSFLGSPQPPPQPPARRHPKPRPAWVQDSVQHVHSESQVSSGSTPKAPPYWNLDQPRRVVSGTWRRSPAQSPPETPVGPDIFRAWETYKNRWLWGARNPRRTCSAVTIKIAPPESRGSPLASSRLGTLSAGCLGVESRPDPCAQETVLRALSQCKKGNRKFNGPLGFEIPEVKGRRQNPEPRPSAFKPRVKNGVVASFVPRPGPLNQSQRSWSLDVCKEVTEPRPYLQPAMGTTPAQGPESYLES